MQAAVWAVVCGTLRDELEFRLIMDRLLAWRQQGRLQGIVLTTWAGELTHHPAIQRELAANHVTVVTSPSNDQRVQDIRTNSVNYWRQATQLQAALNVVPADAVILKTRTDRALPSTRRLMGYLATHETLPAVAAARTRYGATELPQLFDRQVVVLKGRTGRIMQFMDFSFLGTSADLRKLINFDVAELYLTRDLVANTQFFAYPFLHTLPVIKDYFQLINFRPLLEDLNTYTVAGNTAFPAFFERVYAVFFMVLLTHFELISSRETPVTVPETPLAFSDFFHSDQAGALKHDALGVTLDSSRVLIRFIDQARGMDASTTAVLHRLHHFDRTLLERATPAEMAELTAYQAQDTFSTHRWLRQTRTVLTPAPVTTPISMAPTFPGIDAASGRALWDRCLTSENVPQDLLNFWRNHSIEPADTAVYLLPSAKAGNQYSILTLTRLLAAGYLTPAVAAEVLRINNFNGSMHRLHQTINAKVSCYILAKAGYHRDHHEALPAELQRQVTAVWQRYLPQLAPKIAALTDQPDQLVALFDTEIARLDRAGKHVLRRRVIELALEVTHRHHYWTLLTPLFTEKEVKNRQAYQYAMTHDLLGKEGTTDARTTD